MMDLRLVTAVVVMLIFAGIPDAARAQDQPPGPSPQQPPRFSTELVVTPERGETPRHLVPAATAVLDADTLPTLPIVQLSEIISYLAGFHMQDEHPFGTRPLVSARGFFGGGEADYVLLLLDGVPVSDPESGLVDWSLVAASSIRRVEGFRGPGGSLYGDSAIGGVIQVLTDATPQRVRLLASGGSFDTLTSDASYGKRWSRFGFSVSESASRTSGSSAHSSAWQLGGAGSLDGTTDHTQWRLAVSGNARERDEPGPRTDDEFNDDPFGSDRLFRFDGIDRKNSVMSFALGVPGARWQLRTRFDARARTEDQIRTILLVPALGDRQARALSTSGVGGTVETERVGMFAGGPSTFRAGLDVARHAMTTDYHRVNEAGAAGAPTGTTSGHRWRAGAFAQYAWQPVSRLRFSSGFRWDRIADAFESGPTPSRTHDAWSPRVGGTLLIGQDVALFGQISRAFKAPTPEQLFDPRPYPDFAGGTFTISNATLEPQRATNYEAGASGGSRIRWNALVYRMKVRDEIDFDVASFSYANIGNSRHSGFELEIGANPKHSVRPSASYVFQRVTEPGSARQLKNVPRHVLAAAVGLDLGWGFDSHVRYRFSSGAYLDDANEYAIDGLSRIDLRVRRRLGGVTLFLDVLNLADNPYQQYGFTLADFTGNVTAYSYPGAPRAVRFGIVGSF